MISNYNDLLENIDKLHTTELGYMRIKNNLELNTDSIIAWCKKTITTKGCIITRNGKNWYASIDNIIITINAHSFTIITAHKQ